MIRTFSSPLLLSHQNLLQIIPLKQSLHSNFSLQKLTNSSVKAKLPSSWPTLPFRSLSNWWNHITPSTLDIPAMPKLLSSTSERHGYNPEKIGRKMHRIYLLLNPNLPLQFREALSRLESLYWAHFKLSLNNLCIRLRHLW